MLRYSSRRMLWKVTAAATLAIAVLVIAGPAPANAFLRALARALVQTTVLSVRRGQEYERLEGQRDRQVAEVQTRSGIPEWQAEHGWIDQQTLDRETVRYQEWEQGIVDRTEREKKITRSQYGRRIGQAWQEAAVGAIANINGIDPKVRSFLQGVVKGEDVVSSALGALQSSLGDSGAIADVSDVRDRISELRGQWEQAQSVLRAIRDPSALPIQARLGALISEAQAFEEGGSSDVGAAIDRIRDRAQDLRASVDEVKETVSDLLVTGFTVSPDRFTRNRYWRELDAHIQQLAGGSAGRAILSSGARLARERIAEELEARGLTVTDAELSQMAVSVGREYIRQRTLARGEGGGAVTVDVAEIIDVEIGEMAGMRGGSGGGDATTTATTTATATASPTPEAEEPAAAEVTDFSGEWHSTETCDEYDGSTAEYRYQWFIRLEQEGDGVSGSIYLNDCVTTVSAWKNRSYATYLVSGRATHAQQLGVHGVKMYRSGRLKVDRDVPLASVFVLRRGQPPLPNYAIEELPFEVHRWDGSISSSVDQMEYDAWADCFEANAGASNLLTVCPPGVARQDD